MAKTSEYETLRSEIKNGDVALFRGTSILSKLIQLFDKAYYNHAGVIFVFNNRYFILDSNAEGVLPDFLSHRMSKYIDFCIVRPVGWDTSEVDRAVVKIMDRAEKKHIGYDFLLLLQIAIYRVAGIDINLKERGRDVCSEFARRYLNKLELPEKCYENNALKKEDFITPWDFIVYADTTFEIKWDTSDKSKYRRIHS